MARSTPNLRSAIAQEDLRQFLDLDFDPTTRRRGREYLSNGAVGETWEDETTVAGLVQGSDIEPYTTTLTYEDDFWEADCECAVGINCKHAFALGHAWLQQLNPPNASSSPAAKPKPKARKKSFRDIWAPQLGEKIGRPLRVDEAELLGRLSALFHDFHQQGTLTRHALQSSGLAGKKIPYDYNYWQPAFPGWWRDDQPPADPWELWQFIALDWDRNNRDLPEAFRPMTDLAATRARIGQRLIDEELAVWRRSLGSLTAPPTAPTNPTDRSHLVLAKTYTDARIKLEPDGQARLQVRAEPDKPWRHPTLTWMRDLPRATVHDLEAYAEPARSLITHLRLSGNSFNYGLTREGVLDEALFKRLLQHPSTRAAIVLPDETPWRIEETPLVLHARPRPDDNTHLDLVHTLPDGRPAPPDLVPFTTLDAPLYLIENRVIPGPVRVPSTRLPIAALSDPAIATALQSTGLRLPKSLKAAFTPVALQPLIRLWTSEVAGWGHGHFERLHVQLFATAEAPPVRQHFSGVGGWQWTRDGQPPPTTAEGPHYQFDLRAANPVAATFGGFQLQFDHETASWTRGLSANVPELLQDWRAQLPTDLRIETTPELAGLFQNALRARVAVSVEDHSASGVDWFDVSLSLSSSDLTLTEEELNLLLRAKGGWVRLPRRGWKRLEVEDVDAATAATLEKLGLTADPAELLTTRARPETHRFHALQLADTTVADADLAARLRQRVADLRALPPPSLPAALSAELRPYQQEGYHYLAHLASLGLGGILADDMGLGKTVQTLAWLLWLKDQPTGSIENRDSKIQNFRALVVCPKSVVPNWINEAGRFAPSFPTARIEPRQPLPDGAGLLVVNYTQLRLRAADLAAVSWDAVILDEGQNIKNPSSATAGAARDLPARHRLILTGTPIENRLLDLWSLLAFAQPGLLGTQASFQRLYNEKQDPAGARTRLAARVRPFLLRRTKREVARDLPERTEEDLVCELDGPQRKLYDAELKRARQLLLKVENARQFDRERFNILQSLLRLRQICCDPRLVSPSLHKPASAKLEALLDTLEPLVAEGHRVLVFSQFVTMLELIRDELATRDIAHLLLTGQTENRQELVDTFQAPEGPPVFLLSLKAAGAGLNLTAASYVVLFDPWWNPAVEAQAIDRTHRIGQTANVIAYRLIAKDTIEEKIRALQREKAELAAAVVQEESLAKVMDLETLRQVLS